MRHKRGISLVALVITVIIMIILAGISFTAIFGDNGIITQAMLSKERTENAATKEVIELAWAARLSKYYEDLSSGNASSFASYMLDTAYWSGELESFGDFIGIERSDDGSTYNFLLKDKNGNNYQVAVSSSGKAEVKENHIDNDRVLAILTTGNYELAEGVQVEDFEAPKQDKALLYGTKVTTGVDTINGTTVEDNWKIFYIGDGKVNLIYGGIYPHNALKYTEGNIDFDIENGWEIYASKTGNTIDDRNKLINYLRSSPNWSDTATIFENTGTFEGTESITMTGGPTSAMWIDSYNEKYPGSNLAVDDVEYPGRTFSSNDLDEPFLSDGFMKTLGGINDTLYYPWQGEAAVKTGGSDDWWGIHGYWFIDPSSKVNATDDTDFPNLCSCVWRGGVGGAVYYLGTYATRPVISISIDEFKAATNNQYSDYDF